MLSKQKKVVRINNEYIISVTPTYSGCPAVKTFQDDIHTELINNNILNFKMIIVYKPAWTTDWMNDKTKAKLSLANQIYSTFDKTINDKYNVKINQKVLSRIKNTL